MNVSIYQWSIVYWIDLSRKWAMVIEVDDTELDKILLWDTIIEESLYKSHIDLNDIEYTKEVLQDNN